MRRPGSKERSRRRREREQEVGERPPRLVLRFAVLTAICVGCATAGILMLVRDVNQHAAQREATRHAVFVTKTILAREVDGADLAGPVTGERRRRLDLGLGRLLGTLGTGGDGASRADTVISTLAISIADERGRITYSTNHALIGHRLPSRVRLGEVVHGVASNVVGLSPKGETADGLRHKTLESYVPLDPHDYGRGIASISLDYAAIGAAASSAFYPIAGILELSLMLMYLLLVPLLARVSRRLNRQMKRIQHQAYHDDLTGLPNRLHFHERTASRVAELRPGENLAVLIADLDRFKEINDTLGHQAGDTLLRELATRLRGELDDEVALARLGGDEFGLVARVADRGEAEELGRRINEALQEDFSIAGVPVGVEASVGISLCPADGRDVDGLMAKADIAMYQAKSRHAVAVVYEPDFDATHGIEVGLLSELRRALDEHELVLHFQPKAVLSSARITGVEALVRWQHPERGLIFPDQFLPYAKRTGVNRSLTRYVLAAALEQAQEWLLLGLDLHVAVNITMFDLLDLGLAGEVAAALAEAGVPAGRLELEITESEIMSDVGQVRSTLDRLRELGVRVAIDDFGSGYSSLAYLKTLPVDTLKIDKSFVLRMEEDERDAAIVRTAVTLAHTLGLSVVAEGVESQGAWEELGRIGCDVAQGYYLGRPQAAEAVTERLLGAKRAGGAADGRPEPAPAFA